MKKSYKLTLKHSYDSRRNRKMAVQQVPQMLSMLVEQVFFIVTNTHYTTDYI
jgi:hypothetical protein